MTLGRHNPRRFVAMLLSLVIFIVTIALNGLAGAGSGPFLLNTGNISNKYDTDITPSGWTFSIWGVIYAWQASWLIYVFTGLCRRNTYGWMYCDPAVLPYGFYVSWIANMSLNITWLFLWDREHMIPALIFLALIAFTNYLVLFFCCHGLNLYGAWLNTYHRADLWLIRVLVQNGVALYATWTTIATLLNFTVVLMYNGGVSRAIAGTVSLSLLLIELVVWFALENFVLEKHVRYILTVYPVVIVALSGNMTKNFNAQSPSSNGIFIAVLLGIACVTFTVRVVLVIWRHLRHPLYRDADPSTQLSPMNVAETQKKIFI
nr:PREDICTED: uncharacterized protein LOC102694756 [Lepisosteus oculatus]